MRQETVAQEAMHTASPIIPSGSGMDTARRPERAGSADVLQHRKGAKPFGSFVEGTESGAGKDQSNAAPGTQELATESKKPGPADTPEPPEAPESPDVDLALTENVQAREGERDGGRTAGATAAQVFPDDSLASRPGGLRKLSERAENTVPKPDGARLAVGLGQKSEASETQHFGNQMQAAKVEETANSARNSTAGNTVSSGKIVAAASFDLPCRENDQPGSINVKVAVLASMHGQVADAGAEGVTEAPFVQPPGGSGMLTGGLQSAPQPPPPALMPAAIPNFEQSQAAEQFLPDAEPSVQGGERAGEVDISRISPSKDGTLIAISRANIPRSIGAQISAAIATRPGTDRIDISLNPEELGRVSMGLSTKDDMLILTITGDRAETLELMRRNISDLSAEFREMGYNSISFDFRNPGHGSNDTEGEAETPNRNTPEDDPEPSNNQPREIRTAASGLDLRI